MTRQTAVLAIMAALTPSISLAAQQGRYFEVSLGPVAAPGLHVVGSDNDVGTRCDLIINPARVETNGECDVPPPETSWFNEVGGALGILTGVTAGYAARRVRLEAEYLFRTVAYDARVPTVIGDAVTLDKADQELEVADGGVGDVSAHHLFANLHFHLAPESRLRPYVGVGAGAARMSLDYFSRWKRNDDPATITTFVDPALKAKLAGTTTIGEGRLSDSMFGYQLLAGADYAATDDVSFVLKVRRVALADFTSDGHEWLQLRSHDSTVGPGHRVVYSVSTGATSIWTASFGMRYHW